MFREALTKRLSAGMAEAILRKCDEQGENAIEFLIDFIEERADDAFYNAMIRLCDEYDLPVFDDDNVMPELADDFKFVSIDSFTAGNKCEYNDR